MEAFQRDSALADLAGIADILCGLSVAAEAGFSPDRRALYFLGICVDDLRKDLEKIESERRAAP